MALGRAIRKVQNLWAKDNKSTYSHAGIIINPDGTTYESLWHVKSQNLFEAYKGAKVLIARHDSMDMARFLKGYKLVRDEHDGDFYPFYRLIFHLVPPLAKLSIGRVVCSELVAKFLYSLKLFPYYNGCNPDNLHDHIKWARGWSIVFEGKI